MVRRFGQVVGIEPEGIEAYEHLHANVWPDVVQTIHECNIRNYSIFRYNDLLVAYFEHVGDDYASEMAKIAPDPKTQEWWSINRPLQVPLDSPDGEWWKTLPEVFHTN